MKSCYVVLIEDGVRWGTHPRNLIGFGRRHGTDKHPIELLRIDSPVTVHVEQRDGRFEGLKIIVDVNIYQRKYKASE